MSDCSVPSSRFLCLGPAEAHLGGHLLGIRHLDAFDPQWTGLWDNGARALDRRGRKLVRGRLVHCGGFTHRAVTSPTADSGTADAQGLTFPLDCDTEDSPQAEIHTPAIRLCKEKVWPQS